MAMKITCDGVESATFHDDEKALDYLQYAMGKPETKSVTIDLVDESGQPRQDEAPNQASQAPSQSRPGNAEGNVDNGEAQPAVVL